jgi:hypothetical protein
MRKTQFTLFILAAGLISTLSCTRNVSDSIVTTGTLLREMTDLERLTLLPDREYKNVQYSSYDRRSIKPTDSSWFANDDGFGNELIPGFEKVLRPPDAGGIGEYLICDIQKPGAILRLWSAGIEGYIRVFLDNVKQPLYEGKAIDFFWKTIESLSGTEESKEFSEIFRQFDASYFPIPFSKSCRIEWIGDVRKIHFYHIGMRIYASDVKVETFSNGDIDRYAKEIGETVNIFRNPEKSDSDLTAATDPTEINIAPGSVRDLIDLKGEKAIRYFSIRLRATDIESALRKSILSVYFDNSSVPQIHSPVGDFFGAAPGLNPLQSLPFSVEKDGTMICRFIMPFRISARIVIENNSKENIGITSKILASDYKWEEGKTMHFRARWKIAHDLTASNINVTGNDVSDILYLMAFGKGRIVGASASICNPSNAPTSWGNWWGEGDEKIYMDQDTFPSFFGTGSEDYFNYSWSSARLFSYPYCGQPRNDGPGNRGYVSNFRWHILDDLFFTDKLAFYMELGHHGIVPDFSYGRIVYFYALPGLIDDFQKISAGDIRDLSYKTWTPEPYLGSAGYRFIQAENLITQKASVKLEEGKIWAGGKILMWSPARYDDRIKFSILSDTVVLQTAVRLTLAHGPDGGKIVIFLNGKAVKFGGNETINLFEADHQLLDNHFSESVMLNKGSNEVMIMSKDTIPGRKAGIDFIWMKEKE